MTLWAASSFLFAHQAFFISMSPLTPGRIARAALVAHLLCFVLPIGIHVLRGDGWPVVVSSATTLEGAGPLLYGIGILTQTVSAGLVVWAVWVMTRTGGAPLRPVERVSAFLLMPGALAMEVFLGQEPPPPPVYAILLLGLGLGTAARLGLGMGDATASRPDRRVRSWAALVFALAVFSQVSNQPAEGIGTGLHAVTVRGAGAGLIALLLLLRPAAWIWLMTLVLNLIGLAAMTFTWHVLGGAHPLGNLAEALTLAPLFLAIVLIADQHGLPQTR